MKKHLKNGLILPCLMWALAACQAGQDVEQAGVSAGPAAEPGPQATVAIEDLAGRLGVAVGEISLISEKSVTWRDGSLGCPKKDMMYTQALVPGTLIVLAAGGAEYQYHSGQGRLPFYCAAPQPPASANGAE
jgi:hypothetical protein